MSDKTLIVMRHAKSSWKTREADPQRPLSARGTRDAVVAGQVLAPFKINLAMLSTATRAKQTWKCAAMGGARAGQVKEMDELYQGDAEDLIAVVRSLPEELTTVLLLGHEPTLSEVIVELVEPSALSDRVDTKFPTSAIAVVTYAGAWADLELGQASLSELTVPRG